MNLGRGDTKECNPDDLKEGFGLEPGTKEGEGAIVCVCKSV